MQMWQLRLRKEGQLMKRMPYNEKNDKKQDAKTTKGLDKEELKKFKKMDDAHGKRNKPETQTADRKIDEKIVKKIKTQEKRHEAKEGKKGEKLEDKREKKTGKK